MPRNKFELVHKLQYSENIYILYFKSETQIQLIPGQFFKFEIAPNIYRNYSIFSSEDYQSNVLESSSSFINSNQSLIGIIVNTISGGLGSQFIKSININDKINSIGPLGKLALAGNSNQNVFIATSTGIAPFIPMINKIRKSNNDLIVVYFGVKNINDVFCLELLKEFENITIKVCLSQQKEEINITKPIFNNIDCTIHYSRVDAVIQEDIKNYNNATNFYLCGNPEMVQSIGDYLKNSNYNQLIEEKYIPNT